MSALSFFQPAYLWALGFLSVILFLHFFRRRVVKKMNISTLRFLPAAAVSRSRVKKLVDLLLLLARLLLVAALALIFAGLHDRDSPLVVLRDPQSAVYAWVDPTVSMEYAEGGVPAGRSAGQRAADIVDSLATILPPSSERYLFDHESGRFLPLNAAPAGLAQSGSPQSSDREKTVFAGRFGPPGLEEAVEAFLAATGTPDARPSRASRTAGAKPSSDIFIIASDFQRGTTDLLDSLSPRLLDNNKTVICVSTAPAKPYNYTVSVRGGGAFKGEVTAVVRAYGAALDTTFVELTVGNLRVGQRSVYCGKDDSAVVVFDMPAAAAGAWGKVELHAADPLPFDNRDYFTVTADRGRSALVVGSVSRNRVIAAAVRASGPAFWERVEVKEGGELSYEDLNDADLVIVNSFNGRSRILESFITGAGADKGIILCLDPDREDDFGRAFLQSAGLARALSVNTVEKGAHPVLSDTNSALWRGFPALSSANARVYRHLTAIPGGMLVRLGNGRTLVSAVGQQSGRQEASNNMLIISTPIGVTQANNICETGFFVPFIDRLGRYALSGRGQPEEIRYAGYPARNPFFGAGRAGTLYDSDSKLVASWSNQPFVKTDKPGVYSLVSPSGEATNFAVSAHPSEGEVIYTRPDLGTGAGMYFFQSEQFLEQIGNLSNNVWSYWLWVILGLLVCAEVFLWQGKALHVLRGRAKPCTC